MHRQSYCITVSGGIGIIVGGGVRVSEVFKFNVKVCDGKVLSGELSCRQTGLVLINLQTVFIQF